MAIAQGISGPENGGHFRTFHPGHARGRNRATQLRTVTALTGRLYALPRLPYAAAHSPAPSRAGVCAPFGGAHHHESESSSPAWLEHTPRTKHRPPPIWHI